MSEQNRLEINWTNSAGAALGAVSSAVLLSGLGAAGTLIGAALGSLCITIGGALYAHSLRVAKERVAAAPNLAARRPSRERVSTGVGASQGTPRDIGTADERIKHSADPHATGGRDRQAFIEGIRAGLPWKRIFGLAAGLFTVAMALILAFELSTGRAVSTYTGGTEDTGVGTSIPGVSGTGERSSEVPSPDEVIDEVQEDVPVPDDLPLDDLPGGEAPVEAPSE